MTTRDRKSSAELEAEVAALRRELAETREQQAATSEVLNVISRSTFDVQPVFETVVQSALRLCEADGGQLFTLDGDVYRMAVARGGSEEYRALIARSPIPPGRGTLVGTVALERRTVQIPDALAGEAYQWREAQRLGGYRTLAGVPMLRDGVAIGVIVMWRREARPFTERQFELVTTFATQGVIAIENARLFKELQDRTRDLARSVDELRALGEVGQIISSTLDLPDVLTRIVAHAQRLSGADGAVIFEYDDAAGEFHLSATHHLDPSIADALRAAPLRLGQGAVGRAAAARAPVQVSDILQQGAYDGNLRDILAPAGYRALLAVPLLREDRVLGGLAVHRRAPGMFPDAVVALMQSFAGQSALAIQNARLFREIEEKGRQLEEASRHKSQFLANMSHELRTPLNAILGYTELIVDEIYGPVPEKIREVLERVQKSGQHLLGLINAVLDLSKIEAGQLVLSIGDYSLRDVVHTVATGVEGLAAEKGLALEVSVAPDLPIGKGDERRLSQVLMNLVGNAIKFTDAGRVSIAARAADGHFVVAVGDTGPGIAVADRQRIFEEFQQVDGSATRRKGGTGLGLSIARRIVSLHGGRIAVDSEPGTGSTFTVTVPVRVERQMEGA
jgi:signal transduction histidine kinase